MKPENAPRLKSWISVTEAATTLGISRQSVHLMVKAGEFKDLRTIGPVNRPQYLLRESEVGKMKETRTFPRSGS